MKTGGHSITWADDFKDIKKIQKIGNIIITAATNTNKFKNKFFKLKLKFI